MKILVVALATFLPLVAHADNLKTLAMLSGHCKNAMAMDVADDAQLCLHVVLKMELPNGRIGFMFTIPKENSRDVVVFLFFGDVTKQLQLDSDTTLQPIDRVHSSFQGNTDDLVATGSCRFTNPYKGKPSLVSCTADTNRGKFIGEFVSDGRPPNIKRTE